MIYALLCKSTYQKERIEILLQNHVFKNNEKVIVLMMNPKTEEYIRQFIASSYIENNNEDLKTDRVGREELIKIKYQLSQYIETIIPNHQFLKLKLYSYTNKKLTSVNYQSLSTEIH